MMETLNYFDGNCSFGMRSIVDPGSFYTIGDLQKRMAHYGIKKALVYHSMAREYSPAEGNRMLMDEVSGSLCLYPMWVVMHHHTGEFPAPDELKNQLKMHDVRAVRMFPAPKDHYYSIAAWNCGELFSLLETCRIPLFIGLDQLSFDDLYNLCCQYPELRIVLTELGYSVDRNIYALLKKCPNLNMEISGYKVHNGIEEISGRFGAHRLIFGSRMPEFSAGSAVAMIQYARIGEKEKRMIACENLENLLEGVML